MHIESVNILLILRAFMSYGAIIVDSNLNMLSKPLSPCPDAPNYILSSIIDGGNVKDIFDIFKLRLNDLGTDLHTTLTNHLKIVATFKFPVLSL